MEDEYHMPKEKDKDSLFSMDRYGRKPTTKATWEGPEVVDYFKKYFDIPEKGSFGYGSWLRRIKKENINEYHAKQLIEIMLGVEGWLKAKGQTLHRGKWMFNRFRYEIKEKGIDKYIASKK